MFELLPLIWLVAVIVKMVSKAKREAQRRGTYPPVKTNRPVVPSASKSARVLKPVKLDAPKTQEKRLEKEAPFDSEVSFVSDIPFDSDVLFENKKQTEIQTAPDEPKETSGVRPLLHFSDHPVVNAVIVSDVLSRPKGRWAPQASIMRKKTS